MPCGWSVLRTRGVAHRRSLPGSHEIVTELSCISRTELTRVGNITVSSHLLLRVSVKDRVILLACCRVYWNLVLAGKLPRPFNFGCFNLCFALSCTSFGTAGRNHFIVGSL